MTSFIEGLRAQAERARSIAVLGNQSALKTRLSRVDEVTAKFSESWSGSNLGYHADVYYKGFSRPPAGAHWSAEWGNSGMFMGSTGEWVEHPHQEVMELLAKEAGTDLTEDQEAASNHMGEIEAIREAIVSTLNAFLDYSENEYLKKLESKAAETHPISAFEKALALLPKGQQVSRDAIAITSGLRVAPHQQFWAMACGIRSVFETAGKLATIAENAASHLELMSDSVKTGIPSQGSTVFIGHGRSHMWRALKDFLEDRLGLPTNEFNREPVAGITNTARLTECLDQASAAFLVLTAEDEMASGAVAARQNVIHEVGLFQGRLGFTKAIVMLEDGCDEFSNINGLGQIRFPTGNIQSAFEEVRRVLEREALIVDGGI